MKHRILKQVLGLGILLSVIAMPAKAETGFAIGVSGNWADFTTTGTEEENWGTGGAKGIDTNVGKAANNVQFGAVFAEFAGRNNWAGMTVGLEFIPGTASLGSSTRTETDQDASTPDGASTTYTAKADIEDHYQFYIEPTIYATESVGIYLKGAANRVTVRSLESIASGISNSAYGDVDIWGATIGAGLRYKHSSGFLIKTEYSRTKYEGITLTSTTGNKNRIKADPESDNLRLAIGWQF